MRAPIADDALAALERDLRAEAEIDRRLVSAVRPLLDQEKIGSSSGTFGLSPDLLRAIETAYHAEGLMTGQPADQVAQELLVGTTDGLTLFDRVLTRARGHTLRSVRDLAAADTFRSKAAGIHGANLYVALTRAHSMLEVFASHARSADGEAIVAALESTAADLLAPDTSDPERADQADLDTLAALLGETHRPWLARLARDHELAISPITTEDGSFLAHPAFHFTHEGRRTACLLPTARPEERERLEQAGWRVIGAGVGVG